MTTLSSEEAAAAEALFAARHALAPIPPVRDTFGLASAEAAYRVQDANTTRWLASGRRASGRKIGLTSKAVQAQLGVSEPDYGMLWEDLFFEDRSIVPVSRFMQPRVEAEIAFIMRSGLDDPRASASDLVRAIDHCVAAIEIVDSAVEAWNIRLVDTIADNASSGGYVLGSRPRSVAEADLRLCGMVMSQNGQTVSTGVGAACLGHPLRATLWLARKMAEVGRPLAAGDVVISGALGPMVGVAAGDRVLVEIQGFDAIEIGFA